jgi:hypothetical protein
MAARVLLLAVAVDAAALTHSAPRFVTHAAHTRAAVSGLTMQETEVAADLMPPAEESTVVDLSNEAPPEQTRFKVRPHCCALRPCRMNSVIVERRRTQPLHSCLPRQR